QRGADADAGRAGASKLDTQGVSLPQLTSVRAATGLRGPFDPVAAEARCKLSALSIRCGPRSSGPVDAHRPQQPALWCLRLRGAHRWPERRVRELRTQPGDCVASQQQNAATPAAPAGVAAATIGPRKAVAASEA